MLKNGKELTIRKPTKDDAGNILEYMISVGGESDFLTFGEGEWIATVEKEEQFIEIMNFKENSLMLIAILEGDIVGLSSLEGGNRDRTKHVGVLNASVRREFWNLGIGCALLYNIIELSKKNGVIRKINMSVHSDNINAISIYKKNGFVKEGILNRDFYAHGSFHDSILMGLIID